VRSPTSGGLATRGPAAPAAGRSTLERLERSRTGGTAVYGRPPFRSRAPPGTGAGFDRSGFSPAGSCDAGNPGNSGCGPGAPAAPAPAGRRTSRLRRAGRTLASSAQARKFRPVPPSGASSPLPRDRAGATGPQIHRRCRRPGGITGARCRGGDPRRVALPTCAAGAGAGGASEATHSGVSRLDGDAECGPGESRSASGTRCGWRPTPASASSTVASAARTRARRSRQAAEARPGYYAGTDGGHRPTAAASRRDRPTPPPFRTCAPSGRGRGKAAFGVPESNRRSRRAGDGDGATRPGQEASCKAPAAR
jgi:hypothetical protein